MKTSVFAVLGLLMPVCAQTANNNIKMVTYFPIPYVSYNELGVAGTCDLGLMDGCSLDAGSSLLVQKKADNKPLDNGALRLKEGTLSLSGPGVTGNRFVAGTNTISNSRIGFKHSLDVKSMTQSVQSLEVTNRAYLGELNLFGESFPKCENNNSREMTWKRLTINGKEGVFLVCGAGEKQEHVCPDSGVRGDARTWWDASVQKCGCPNAGEYYHNGACCSSSSEQSNAFCWQKVTYQWQALAAIKYQDPSVGSGTCDRSSDNRYYNLYLGNYNNLVPNGSPLCAFTQGLKAVILCNASEAGNVCVKSCLVQMMNEPEMRIPNMVTVSGYRCVQNQIPRYLPKWDTSQDTRYGCPHQLPVLPGIVK